MVSPSIHIGHSHSGLLEIWVLPLACCLWGMGIFAEAKKPSILWVDGPSPGSCHNCTCLVLLSGSSNHLPSPNLWKYFSSLSPLSTVLLYLPLSLHVSPSPMTTNIILQALEKTKAWNKSHVGAEFTLPSPGGLSVIETRAYCCVAMMQWMAEKKKCGLFNNTSNTNLSTLWGKNLKIYDFFLDKGDRSRDKGRGKRNERWRILKETSRGIYTDQQMSNIYRPTKKSQEKKLDKNIWWKKKQIANKDKERCWTGHCKLKP